MLGRSEPERAELIGRLADRDDTSWLAEILIEIEADPNGVTRLRVVVAIQPVESSVTI